MPVMDGSTAMKRIKRLFATCLEQNSDLLSQVHCPPIIAVTANAGTAQKQDFIESGFDDCLIKPVSREDLELCLRRNLFSWMSKLLHCPSNHMSHSLKKNSHCAGELAWLLEWNEIRHVRVSFINVLARLALFEDVCLLKCSQETWWWWRNFIVLANLPVACFCNLAKWLSSMWWTKLEHWKRSTLE